LSVAAADPGVDLLLYTWDFGDGSTSTDQNPIHEYKAGRDYTAILEVEGPAGKSRLANVWGVSVK